MMTTGLNDKRSAPFPVDSHATFPVEPDGDSRCSEDDDASSSSSFSSSTTRHSGSSKCRVADEVDVEMLNQRERKSMNSMRCIVFTFLILIGALVTAGTYVALNTAENAQASKTYVVFTEHIADATEVRMNTLHQGLSTLSEAITATAVLQDDEFPYVTLSAFEVHGWHVTDNSGVENVFYSPLVIDSYKWVDYSTENENWIPQSLRLSANAGRLSNFTQYVSGSVPSMIYGRGKEDGEMIPSTESPFLPIWQTHPPPFDPIEVNFDLMTLPWMSQLFRAMTTANEKVFSRVSDFSHLQQISVAPQDDIALAHPHTAVFYPVYRRIGRSHDSSEITGIITAVVSFKEYVSQLIPDGVDGIVCVLSSSCGQTFTYTLEGNMATYAGPSDRHDPKYDDTKTEIPLSRVNATNVPGHCEYSLFVYASDEYTNTSTTNNPAIYAAVVAVAFLLVIAIFFFYDCSVQKRNSKVVVALMRSHTILSSLFPSNVRARLFAENEGAQLAGNGQASGTGHSHTIKGFLEDGESKRVTEEEQLGYSGTPIADLFPSCTVLFMDIAGFTAWSSVREPCQVFTLLETIYKEFDEIAKRRRVFKVETIGDCYVAVTGLPDPRKDHALIMCRFALEAIATMRTLTKKLEVSLGPDTGDLDMRVGIHSGPVTAGVLRGERSRFQLFGDTMNTASRIESTGRKGCIQISQETADLLIAAGKEHWVISREEMVVAKGKGEIQTYWLVSNGRRVRSSSVDLSRASSASESYDDPAQSIGVPTNKSVDDDSRLARAKITSLVEWNTEVLLRLLKQIVARRMYLIEKDQSRAADADESVIGADSTMVIDEVKEIIVLPEENFNSVVKDAHSIVLDEAVVQQLRDFVLTIALTYNDNPFHNFEHASHVTMSVVKLLSRIVAPSEHEYDEKGENSLHDHTYGITSDPLTQFACVLSALIHDADHPGVPNVQLLKEDTMLSQQYQGKSIAEQNSVDLAWSLLMQDQFADLRKTIYTTARGLQRFRQLVVNSVMATDIVDKELKTLRNDRWAKAFCENTSIDVSPRDAINRKATVVIEHLIQASDVAHTMQHWHIYRKWNERFFMECYAAYLEGRAEKNPVEGWYQGELGFFDFYIIPLAKKLKDCGVFGVSSDEYLNYAVHNRKEWEARGREQVDEMVEKVNAMQWPQT